MNTDEINITAEESAKSPTSAPTSDEVKVNTEVHIPGFINQTCFPSPKTMQKQNESSVVRAKAGATKTRKAGSWKQAVVDKLRLPGPTLTREQFLSCFVDATTGLSEESCTAVFMQLKSIGLAGGPDFISMPTLLQLLEQLHDNDVADIFDAFNSITQLIKHIDQSLHTRQRRSPAHEFAAKWLLKLMMRLTVDPAAEVELMSRRNAPENARRTYMRMIDECGDILAKSVAIDRKITFQQATLIVSKCMHNMRVELENDISELKKLEIMAEKDANERKVTAAVKARLENIGIEEAERLGIHPTSPGISAGTSDAQNVVSVKYVYPDGTPVENPAHLPEGAQMAEAAAHANLTVTAEMAKRASYQAEATALAVAGNMVHSANMQYRQVSKDNTRENSTVKQIQDFYGKQGADIEEQQMLLMKQKNQAPKSDQQNGAEGMHSSAQLSPNLQDTAQHKNVINQQQQMQKPQQKTQQPQLQRQQSMQTEATFASNTIQIGTVSSLSGKPGVPEVGTWRRNSEVKQKDLFPRRLRSKMQHDDASRAQESRKNSPRSRSVGATNPLRSAGQFLAALGLWKSEDESEQSRKTSQTHNQAPENPANNTLTNISMMLANFQRKSPPECPRPPQQPSQAAPIMPANLSSSPNGLPTRVESVGKSGVSPVMNMPGSFGMHGSMAMPGGIAVPRSTPMSGNIAMPGSMAIFGSMGISSSIPMSPVSHISPTGEVGGLGPIPRVSPLGQTASVDEIQRQIDAQMQQMQMQIHKQYMDQVNMLQTGGFPSFPNIKNQISTSSIPQNTTTHIPVKSLNEVPTVKIGNTKVVGIKQLNEQLDSLPQQTLEMYASQYGVFSTPEAAAASMGGIPLAGVGALKGINEMPNMSSLQMNKDNHFQPHTQAGATLISKTAIHPEVSSTQNSFNHVDEMQLKQKQMNQQLQYAQLKA